MKKIFLVSLCLMMTVALVASFAMARTTKDKAADLTWKVDFKGSNGPTLDQDLSKLNATAQGATTFLYSATFDAGGSCDEAGWTHEDLTQQTHDFWHVDDFAGLGGGSFGGLVAPEGSQAMWCGARPDAGDLVLCGYLALPGYGNGWNQALCSACIGVGNGVTIDYLASWDSEPGYDATAVEIDNCDENWVQIYGGIGIYDGAGSETASVAVADSLHGASMRVRFHFTADGAWSDQDALWDTDGAFILDSLSVSDAGGLVIGVEDFEGEVASTTTNNTDDGNWVSCTPLPYGDFAMLYNALFLVQEDPCTSNLTCVWTFYTGSLDNYGCGGFPAQTAVPYVNARDQYINNEVWSPVIPISGSGAVYDLNFQSYRDLELDALIFYVWHVRSFVAGCPTAWEDRNFVYFGGQKDWITVTQTFGDLVAGGATDLQVALGAVDMCGVWCGSVGTGACHSHAPLLDNVNVYRVAVNGPQWATRDINMFQDNFSEDGTTTGTARADAAIDVLPAANTNIAPGDSVALEVSDPDNGLAADSYTGFGSAVYLYVGVWPQGQPGKGGGALTQDSFRWPVVDSLTSGGDTWYCLRMDTTFTDGAARTGVVPNGFCVDLNDNLFTPGDTICFFFCATSATTGDKTYFADGTGSTPDQAEAIANPSEFQILPGGGWAAGGDILYVDGMSGRGAQPFFDTAFEALNIYGLVDRYDIRGPSSSVANRPGARVKDVFQQIIGCYRKIIWNTGDLNNGLIGDGTGQPEKSDDAGMLFTFLTNLPNTGGVYFNGDNIADEWVGLGGAAVSLKIFITHNLVNDSHVNAGYGTAPYAIGMPSSCFDHGVSPAVYPDTVVAYGGCALINDFDVLEPTGTATLEMTYNGAGTSTSGAVIGQKTLNSAGFTVGVILSGFSYHYIRDDRPLGNVLGVLDRIEHMYDILVWLENNPQVPVDVTPDKTARYSLDQNYPNPFNPTTTIKYEVKEAGNVTLKIYNVAGQLVRTLVNDTKAAGVTHVADWNGRNDAGELVSSGVYFYKLTAGNFTQTKKMVLLK